MFVLCFVAVSCMQIVSHKVKTNEIEQVINHISFLFRRLFFITSQSSWLSRLLLVTHPNPQELQVHKHRNLQCQNQLQVRMHRSCQVGVYTSVPRQVAVATKHCLSPVSVHCVSFIDGSRYCVDDVATLVCGLVENNERVY